MSALHAAVAQALHRDAAALAARWEDQARAVAPRRQQDDAAEAGAGRGERLVRAVAAALADSVCGQQELVRAGWELGATSHGSEQSLHYLLKELNLLSAMLLYAGERALAEVPAGEATAAEGMAVARRIQRSVSLLTLAASKGFTHDYLMGLRTHYRTLRHDLRNPLGTIRSAITLMEDESVAPEMRNDPRFRAMVTRNATSIDRLIGGQLSDDSMLGPALARQSVSLYEVARAVRRELRDEAKTKGCEILVDEALPPCELDSVGAELALRALVTESLDVADAGSTVRIAYDGAAVARTCVVVAVEGPVRAGAELPLSDSLRAELATWSGGGRAEGTRARSRLEFPTRTPHLPAPAADAVPSTRE